MRAPDGSYEEGFIIPEIPGSPKGQSTTWNLETNNPLSLHKEVRRVAILPEKRIHEAVESMEGMVCFCRIKENHLPRC
jgi:hypothetical protein